MEEEFTLLWILSPLLYSYKAWYISFVTVDSDTLHFKEHKPDLQHLEVTLCFFTEALQTIKISHMLQNASGKAVLQKLTEDWTPTLSQSGQVAQYTLSTYVQIAV